MKKFQKNLWSLKVTGNLTTSLIAEIIVTAINTFLNELFKEKHESQIHTPNCEINFKNAKYPEISDSSWTQFFKLPITSLSVDVHKGSNLKC